jgi:hypothetical protein
MRSSPSPSNRPVARFVPTWALVLGLGLAGFVVGCGPTGREDQVDPVARKAITEANQEYRKEQMQKAKEAAKHKEDPTKGKRQARKKSS